MTLVVARKIERQVRIISDWKLTAAAGGLASPMDGALKAIALSPDLCVAYSTSDVDLALDAIRTAIREAPSGDASQLADELSPFTQQKLHEFLVASQSALHVVKNGYVERNQSAGWLGDRDAFNEYQEQYHEYVPLAIRCGNTLSSFEEIIDRMGAAFESVVESDAFPTVAGFRITLVSHSSRGEGFHYLPMQKGYDFQPVSGDATHSQSMLRTRGPEGGGYSYTILVPQNAGVGTIGAYFREGRFGLLFRPLHHPKPIVVDEVSQLEFISAVRNNQGVHLTGFLWPD